MYTPMIPDPSVYKMKDPTTGIEFLAMHPDTLQTLIIAGAVQDAGH